MNKINKKFDQKPSFKKYKDLPMINGNLILNIYNLQSSILIIFVRILGWMIKPVQKLIAWWTLIKNKIKDLAKNIEIQMK